MDFLRQAEEYVKKLEARIAQLEKENDEKEKEIRRLSVSGGGAAPAAAAAAAAAPAAAAAAAAPAAATPSNPLANLEGPRVKIPSARVSSTPAEVEQSTVYDDDPALGKKAPATDNLKWFNGSAVSLTAGKPTVMTFFSKLNKGDFATLSVMSEMNQVFGDKVQFAAVSRDGEEEDAAKFAKKYHGKRFEELSGPNGEAGCTVYMTYPLAYDAGDAFNAALKQTMRKGTVGVGMAILFDGEGTIRWYETYIRGQPVKNQLIEQIRNLIDGKPLLSNGNAPVVQAQEEVANIPDDVDPFAKGKGNY